MKEYEAIYFYYDIDGNKVPVGVTDYGALSDLLLPTNGVFEILKEKAGYFHDVFVEVIGIGCYLLKERKETPGISDGENHGA